MSRAWPLALAVALTGVVYVPVTQNYFFADDFLHLFAIANGDLVRFLLEPFGGHVYLVRNLVYALCYAAFGIHAAPYLWLALLTHLVNVALLCHVVQLATASSRLALVAATAWGICPFHAEPVGWYAVYGQLLIGTILLSVLARLLVTARDGVVVDMPTAAVWYALVLAAATCWGVGIGIACVFPLVALLVLPPRLRPRRVMMLFLSLPVVVVALYVVVNAVYVLGYGGSVRSVAYSVGTLRFAEPLVRMVAYLVGTGMAALVAGFVVPAAALRGTPALVGLLLLATAVAGAAARGSRGERRTLLALALLPLAAYGMIAIGRAHIALAFGESLVEAATVPRYHYVGSLGLTLLAGVVLTRLDDRWVHAPGWVKSAAVALWLVLATAAYVRRGAFIDHHVRDRMATEGVLTAIHAAVAAAPAGAPVYIENRPFTPVLFLVTPAKGFPGWAAIFLIAYRDVALDGRRVYFVERSPEVLATAARGGRIAALLVPATDRGS